MSPGSTTGDGPPRYISSAELDALLPGAAAVDALEAGFLARAAGAAPESPRSVLRHEHGDFLSMPAVGSEGAGAKLVSVVPANPGRGLPLINGIYVLFSPDTLLPELLIDGPGLTRLRTAAVSALGARHLARPESSRMVVFGAGAQADAHARMIGEILPIEEVTIVGSSPGSRGASELAERLRADGIEARPGGPEALVEADVVFTCTTSATPVFESALLAPGAHVGAVGSFKPTLRELDLELLGRALLVVETLEAAGEEAGEVVQGLAAGVLEGPAFAVELTALLRGEVVREAPEQISVFKTVGLPSEDLIVARAAAERLG